MKSTAEKKHFPLVGLFIYYFLFVIHVEHVDKLWNCNDMGRDVG